MSNGGGVKIKKTTTTVRKSQNDKMKQCLRRVTHDIISTYFELAAGDLMKQVRLTYLVEYKPKPFPGCNLLLNISTHSTIDATITNFLKLPTHS